MALDGFRWASLHTLALTLTLPSCDWGYGLQAWWPPSRLLALLQLWVAATQVHCLLLAKLPPIFFFLIFPSALRSCDSLECVPKKGINTNKTPTRPFPGTM